MSHFTVLVIDSKGNDTVEDVLEPFYEGIEMPEYVAGEVTKKDWDNMREYYEKENESVKTMSNDEMYEMYGDGWNGESWRKDENGVWKEYSTYNPDSKWDWFVIGGRWRGMLILKEGKTGVLGQSGVFDNDPMYKDGVDQARFGDVDWDKMNTDPELFEKYSRQWELIVEGDKPKNKEEENIINYNFYKPEYYTEKYGNKETYVKALMMFSTYAVLKDGKWFEPGEMGWFGMSSASNEDKLDFELNFYNKFLKDLPDDALLTVVDCHI
jgi:hypothetical protein